ncbi:unnamed protein product [Eruca vesicaria subsp. sativa]|uniref:RBR-type E3 ubiquitin transferase n=1 Tax=Eruca vesicaria subsp. sativa TaxID=29727 RepID=A0ABC8ILF7_ERUVS|nr:unnamed protein product [Eruca vesicaria subsp. sativa]
MESNGQRLYSVLTRAEVLDKMMKEIFQISEVFSISQPDATLTLIRLGWDSIRASDLLGDNKEKFLSKLGLDDNNLVSTPLCSHKFCSDCWKDYHLSKSLEKEDKSEMIQDCVVSVGHDTVEEMYERYVLGSFMDSNKIKWCPASGCVYAIQRHGGAEDDDDEEEKEEEETSDDDFGVVCLCGHTFCWKCKLESHRPVTCNNASLWLNELLEEARTLSLYPKTTKPCPSCNTNVQKLSNVDWKIVTCVCSHAFCWRCLREEEDHHEYIRCSKVHVPPPSNEVSLLHHLTLWEEYDKAIEASKDDLEAIELHIIPMLTSRRGLGELDMRALREALVLIIQCRLVLKWSCMFGYFLTDYHSGKKKYLDHLQEVATANLLKHKESVYELVNGEDVTGFRHKVETLTTATGNYFHYFVKTVEDGLSDVKGGVFEDVATDYWFCDRCTFQNDSFEQKCRVCVFPFEGPSPLVANNNNGVAVAHQQLLPNVSFDVNNSAAASGEGGTDHVAFGNNNNASGVQQGVPYMSSNPFSPQPAPFVAFGNSDDSVHQQQVPNMSNNPFAREGGGANVFESRPVGFGVSGYQQQKVPNMMANSAGGPSYFPMPPPSVVTYGNNSIGTTASANQQPNMVNNPFAQGPIFYPCPPPFVAASAHQQPNMVNNPFARQEVPIFYQFPPPFVAASAHQQEQVPNMANLNPFGRPGGGTYQLQSPPFMAFGNNNNSGATASAHQQQAPNMMVNNPSELGNNNSSASGHQQQAPNMPNLVKEEANLENSNESEW